MPSTALRTTIFSALLLLALRPFGVFAQPVLPAGDAVVPFEWLSISTPAGPEPYAALLLPVTLPGCPERLYMQFDLGAPHSLFYKQTMAAIRRRYPASVPGADTSTRLDAISFTLGSLPVSAANINLKAYDTTGSGSGPRIIGSIGSDLIAGRVVAIDYPGRRILLADSLPLWARGTELQPLVWVAGSVLLTAQVQGAKTMLFFDTGSSAFPLLTDSATAAAMTTAGAREVTYPVRSWSRTLTAHRAPSADSIGFGGLKIPLRTVAWMEGVPPAQSEGMRRMGIGGMTGNALFAGSVLLLDLKAKKFAVFPAGAAVAKKGKAKARRRKG